MSQEEKKTNSYLSNLAIVRKSVGNIFTERAVFYDDGDSLIVSSGRSLHIYDTSTGNRLREIFQCSDNIISFQLHPLISCKLVVVTENGVLYLYNLSTNRIDYFVKLILTQKFLNKQGTPKFNLKEKESGNTFDWRTQSLNSLACRKFLHAEVKAFLDNPVEIFVWASWCLNDEFQSHLSAFTLSNGKQVRLIHIHKSNLKKCSLNFVLKTVQDFEVLVGISDDYVLVVRYDAQKRPFSLRHYVGHGKALTTVAFHPTECSFATGDSLGRIIIWKNIFEKQPLKDILHWHTLPVHDLFFSEFGNYLFSGGEENVLVKWSLNSYNKDFLPRLSSVIHHISGTSESSLLAVSTMDNKILILDFNFEKISTVQHFSRWSILKGENKPIIFTLDPQSNCFVLNGKTGHLQFLALNEDVKFIYTFDVTNRNFITSNTDRIIENTEVTHAKFNKTGKWLITAESRGSTKCKESRLKFWLHCKNRNSFILNTNVEFPHEEFDVCFLEISTNDMVATTGRDKKFRLWSIFEHDQELKKKNYWAVHAIIQYRNFSCYSIDFSKDASLIAVTFGPILTIWETDTCALKCTLSVPHGKDDLKFCKFGNYGLSHLVVTGTECNVSCWNVITLSVIWAVPLKLSLLISDPFSIFMIAFTTENSLVIFNPSSPNPNLILKQICDYPVAAAHCVTSESGKLCLYFLSSNQELFCLEDAEKVSSNASNGITQVFSTPYSKQLPEIQNRVDFDKSKTVLLNENKKQSVSCLLDAPAHTLPNPSLLCFDVLKGLLVFSVNLSTDKSSAEDVKNDGVKINKTPGNCAKIDSDKMEEKLLNIVKTIFE